MNMTSPLAAALSQMDERYLSSHSACCVTVFWVEVLHNGN